MTNQTKFCSQAIRRNIPTKSSEPVVYKCFFHEICPSNDAPTWRHFPCILKNVDVGYCRKLSVVRERGLSAVSRGVNRRVLVLKTRWTQQVIRLLFSRTPSVFTSFSRTYTPRLQPLDPYPSLRKASHSNPCRRFSK